MNRETIRKCKDNHIQPWYLEDLIVSGSPDLIFEKE